MFAVVFIRRDGQPNEEYYYNKEDDARVHFVLFENDDSNLYKRILLMDGALVIEKR